MFNFIRRGTSKQGGSNPPPANAPEQKTAVAAKGHPAQSPNVAQERGYKIGQTLRVKGLGDFLIHDIKGGEGKSGMGIVYIVLDANSTPFAVKTLQRCFLNTPDLVRQFLRECETWIRLEQHQNIVRAYYVAVIDEQPYVFLEYISGSDLRKKLVAGRLPVRNALRYSIQFCRGMVHAQQKVSGIVHRDIKPENCLLTSDDVLKVTDFGLVKALANSGPMVGAAALD